ncbi:hypothetical protein [Flavobacterium urocaniciphilum]|uniref:Uncharacterized protein n=1 Tax=Flavobacterium urocaniciphilum TaxID=1299341 RepID=A0A1H9CXS3_9FLAO|nr:hypothetical protein [Flavobacterium urocaniciphilum]SEQ05917.1 hypothetical protein SAMN05444005_105143 [Flavobacterium urocaniciphilum]
MKKSVLIFGLILLFMSCRRRVENYVEFSENQPVDVEEIQNVPENWFGNYRSIDSSLISIEKDKIIEKWFSDWKISIKEKDSFPNLTFQKNFVIDNTTNEKTKLISKNDSLFWKEQYSDTIFIKDKILKLYKDALILNTNDEGRIYIDVLKKENNQIRKFSIDSKEDFEKLKREIKVDFEYKYSNNDTTVIVKPTKSDFRKILRKKGYTNEMIYTKI